MMNAVPVHCAHVKRSSRRKYANVIVDIGPILAMMAVREAPIDFIAALIIYEGMTVATIPIAKPYRYTGFSRERM